MKRACVIGAGSSGIAAAKALFEAGIPFDVYEASDRVGGNWVFGNVNGMSSAYEGLYINTSRDRMQYTDFPMPRDYPDFPHHSQIARYFEAYVDHFGFRDTIRFRTTVARADERPDGTWSVRVRGADGEETHEYGWLLVANGHHWDPLLPDPPFPGTFAGREMHAHHYKSKKELEGKRVVVVGMGNSAMDIAVESSEVAARTFLSGRRGVHVLPKYMLGRPLDQIFTSARIPWKVRQKMAEAVHRLAVGDMTRYGLPKPDHRLGDAHPTISGRILDRLSHGAITPKPNIERLEGDLVRFVDGSVEEADVIVYCTGYKVTFPFFDEALVAAKDNDLPLFLRVFDPRRARLAFVGLLQPLGAIMPLAEAQGRWIAKWIKGDYVLPPLPEMQRRIEAERRAMFARYVRSKRHTMQVDFDDYLLDLRREIARGTRRA
ncbi:MAG: NAD(P)-binding domain-containing protein [Labilithrix sp.]|nr:NAD(P)-binding domain-containing protein [Labilithrix sp.]MCW5815217.1 NAD(P)-binding domain-containing protein [Labilithrix sp.]